jgi:hypothetical protein
MKTLHILIISILSLQNCANQMQDTFPVKITEAYHHHWVAGVRGGGSGTSFYITFEKILPNDLELNQLYFRKNLAKVHKVSETQYLFSFVGKANQHRANEFITDDAPKAKDIEPPFKVEDNEAILEYTHKGTKKYFKLTNLKQKEMEAYPMVKPRN